MIVHYIAAARFEEIEAEEPWYGEIPELRGFWATGRTEEECRARLAEALDGWLLVRLRPIPRPEPIRRFRALGFEGP